METSLLQLIASGNHQAFKTLFTRYFPKVKCFITHLIKSETIAEEFSQDIFAKIWVNRVRLVEIQSIQAYLYQMAKHKCLNYFETRKLEAKYQQNYHHASNQHGVEEDLFAKEIELLVLLTVNKMPPQRKLVYEMSRYHHFTNDEIALQLNITKKTVENHLNTALKEIRKTIQLLSLLLI